MLPILFCAALSAGIFALAALAIDRWPERLSRRGHHLLGQPWRGQWGAAPTYAVVEKKRPARLGEVASG